MELILSSGFLAFASHIGFLKAVEKMSVSVTGICGTSSGALVAALWNAGMSAEAISVELQSKKPYQSLGFHPYPWQGLFSLGKLQMRLQELLPSSFKELSHPFGVGVCDLKWRPHIVQEGDLVAAVVASCSIPYLFAPVLVNSNYCCDGGAADRIGAAGWRKTREEESSLVHIVERSRGAKEEKGLEGALLVRSPRSGASFWSLKDFDTRVERSYQKTLSVLQESGSL